MLKAKWDCNHVITSINHTELVSNGIQTLFIDVDGTLLPRSEKQITNGVKDWIKKAKELFHIHLISNNPSKNRIKYIAEQLDLDFTYRAGKPRTKSIKNCISNKGIIAEEAAIIGDRIFTDILVGNKLGLYTILVKKIDFNGCPKKSNTQIIEIKIANLLGRLKL